MSDARIPLAWSVRWRRMRSQLAPMAVFAVAVAASGWLWRERGVGVQSVGEVSSPRVDVTSPTTGLLVALPNPTNGGEWSEFDRIEAGDIVARIEEQSGEAAQAIEIKAPISGTLVRIGCRPGQTVIPGKLIATIAADQGRHIVGFIPEDSTLAAKRGMRVSLRPRTAGSPRIESEVEEVGSHIQKIPSHQQANISMPQWGTPVRIKLPDGAILRPGALVDLVFEAPAVQ